MGYGLHLYGEEAIQYGIADHVRCSNCPCFFPMYVLTSLSYCGFLGIQILPRGKKKIRPQKKVTKELDQSLEPKVSGHSCRCPYLYLCSLKDVVLYVEYCNGLQSHVWKIFTYESMEY